VDDEYRWAIENLKTPCVDSDYLDRLNGITWPVDAQFNRDFEAFLRRRGNPCDDGKVNRYAFELFLQSQDLLTRNDSAAGLGMQPESLDKLLPELPRIGLSKKYQVYMGIIEKSLGDDLVRTLPGLRFRTFGTHDLFCEYLHHELNESLGLSIQPLYCATADRLGEQRMYASTWDNITLLPLGAKHSVWLDFNKPLSLPPDRCSKLFCAENYDEMRPYLFGREEPRDLASYSERTRRPA
jgi:hypothetical protein